MKIIQDILLCINSNKIDYKSIKCYREWFNNYWKISIIISILYVLGLIYGILQMNRRPAINLKFLSLIWNLCAAMFSIYGFYIQFPYFKNTLLVKHIKNAFYFTTCRRWFDKVEILEFSMLLFVFSRFFLLGKVAYIQ